MRLVECAWCRRLISGLLMNIPFNSAINGGFFPEKINVDRLKMGVCIKCFLYFKLILINRQNLIKLYQVDGNKITKNIDKNLSDLNGVLPMVRCPICLASIPSVTHLSKHINEQIKCEICGIQVESLAQLRYHQAQTPSCSLKIVYACERTACGASFAWKSLFDLHQFYCTRDLTDTENEVNENHENSLSENSLSNDTPATNETQLQSICPKRLRGKGNRKTRSYRNISSNAHSSDSERNEISTCNYCQKSYKGENNLKRHQKWFCKFRPLDNVQEDVDCQNECSICGKFMHTKMALYQHLRVHKRVACGVCQKEVSKHRMNVHLMSHDNEAVVCEQCGKTQRNRAALLSHIQFAHTERDKRYPCDKCDLKFVWRKQLKLHRVVHEVGQKQHFCEKCGRGFYTMLSLHNHMRNKHERVRKHVCNICGQVLTARTSLVVHLRRHTGEKPYQCDVCSMAFKQKRSLSRHRQTVHHIVRDAVEPCPYCGKMFTQNSVLKCHIVKMH